MKSISRVCLLVLFFVYCGKSFRSWKWVAYPPRRYSNTVCLQDSGTYIPDNFYSRLNEGFVSYQELEPLFRMTKDRLLEINKPSGIGYIGFIMNLENSLIDAESIYSSCLIKLSVLFNQPKPVDVNIRGLIGIPISDAIGKLGWEFPVEVHSKCEEEFYRLIKEYVESNAIRVASHAVELLKQIENDKNDISVISYLPRDIVQYIFTKTSLVRFFKGKVSPRQLITIPPLSQLTDKPISNSFFSDSDDDSALNVFAYSKRSNYEGNAFVKSRYIAACGYMHKLPYECVMIDGIVDHVVLAKQLGMTCIALDGFTNQVSSLRIANRIISSLADITMEDIYKMARATINIAQGPKVQLQPAPKLNLPSQRQRVRTTVINSHKMLKRKIMSLLVHMQFLQAHNITITEETIQKYYFGSESSQNVQESSTIYDYQDTRKESKEYVRGKNDDEGDEDESNDDDEHPTDSVEDGLDLFDDSAMIQPMDDDEEEEEEAKEETPEEKQFICKQMNKFYSLISQIESLHKQIQVESKNDLTDIHKDEEEAQTTSDDGDGISIYDMDNLQTNLIRSLICLEKSRKSQHKQDDDDDADEGYEADAAYVVRELNDEDDQYFSASTRDGEVTENEEKPSIYDYQLGRK